MLDLRAAWQLWQLMSVRLNEVTEIRHHHGARIDHRVAHGLRLISPARIDTGRSHAERRVLGGNPGKAYENLTEIDCQFLIRIVFRLGQRRPRPEYAVAVRCHIGVVMDLRRADAEPGVVYRRPADTYDPSDR